MKRVRKAFKKYFIPHEENDHRPHILRWRAVVFVLAVMFVAEGAFVLSAKYLIPKSKLFGVILVNALVDGTNQNRAANGLSGLHEDPILDQAAQEKANDMAKNGYFAHTSPTGVTPWFWFQDVGYNFSYAGENLAVNFTDSQDVTNAWMNSPEHRANILNANYTEIGMATAQGMYEGYRTTFVVELFGTPTASPFAFLYTASAATGTSPAPASAPVKPATKPIALKPVKPVAITVLGTTTVNATSEPISVAVKGIETSTQPASGTAAVPAVETLPVAQVAAAPQANFLQRELSDPKKLANDFYLLLMAIFAVAVILNIFIKVRIQHPTLIMSGLLIIVAAGLCVLFNENLSFLHAVIL